MSIEKGLLEELYNVQKLSMAEIANRLGNSPSGVAYLMRKYGIPRRDISEAIYQWHNPDGDPFEFHEPETEEQRRLFDLGIALYIGEGTKRNPNGVILANTDPRVIRAFIRFLREICGVAQEDLFAAINIFDDVDLPAVQVYWEEVTGLSRGQFYKPTVRPHRVGTYTNKSEYGTLTVGVSNTKLRRLIQKWSEEYLGNFS